MTAACFGSFLQPCAPRRLEQQRLLLKSSRWWSMTCAVRMCVHVVFVVCSSCTTTFASNDPIADYYLSFEYQVVLYFTHVTPLRFAASTSAVGGALISHWRSASGSGFRKELERIASFSPSTFFRDVFTPCAPLVAALLSAVVRGNDSTAGVVLCMAFKSRDMAKGLWQLQNSVLLQRSGATMQVRCHCCFRQCAPVNDTFPSPCPRLAVSLTCLLSVVTFPSDDERLFRRGRHGECEHYVPFATEDKRKLRRRPLGFQTHSITIWSTLRGP